LFPVKYKRSKPHCMQLWVFGWREYRMKQLFLKYRCQHLVGMFHHIQKNILSNPFFNHVNSYHTEHSLIFTYTTIFVYHLTFHQYLIKLFQSLCITHSFLQHKNFLQPNRC
jgi:hypothetical protein